MKHAACVYIKNPKTGLVVLTTRRRAGDEPVQYGLPGGKVDPGETPIQAAVRETFEETGIVLNEKDLSVIFTEVCKGEVDYATHSFYVEFEGRIPGGIEPDIDSGWGTHQMLIEQSPFAPYNLQLFEILDNETISKV